MCMHYLEKLNPFDLHLKDMKYKCDLQVSIPTFNRSDQLAHCLRSLVQAFNHLNETDRNRVGISIQNNSTKGFAEYQTIFEFFNREFLDLNINYFNYIITGFNIGSANNCATSLINSQSKYTWFLPDDDLAEVDSLAIILSCIKSFSPCLIHGGRDFKTVNKYNQFNVSPDFEPNEILSIEYQDRILKLFSDNVVQAQELVFKTDLISQIVNVDGNIPYINEMFPGFFSIYSLANNSLPLIFLKRSIGIFRDGDPNSMWRNRWLSLSLITWPEILEYCFSIGLINRRELAVGKKIFIEGFKSIEHRPDIFLGLNQKFPLNARLLMKHHPHEMCSLLIKSPKKICLKIYTKLVSLHKIFINE